MDEALYLPTRDGFQPTGLTVGPWYDDSQHGGPVAALLTRAVEELPSPVAVQTVRVTIELLRPVPLAELRVRSALVRSGKRVQLAEASLLAGDTEVARARALRIRVERIDVPPATAEMAEVADPDGIPALEGPRRTAFLGAVDLRFASGSWDEVGPVKMWGRLVVPVVAGEQASPLQRTAAIADFGNGVSRVVDFETHMFINPDLTVALSRVPEGDWIGYDVVTRLSDYGYGQAESRIFDKLGPVGRSVQSLLVSKR